MAGALDNALKRIQQKEQQIKTVSQSAARQSKPNDPVHALIDQYRKNNSANRNVLNDYTTAQSGWNMVNAMKYQPGAGYEFKQQDIPNTMGQIGQRSPYLIGHFNTAQGYSDPLRKEYLDIAGNAAAWAKEAENTARARSGDRTVLDDVEEGSDEFEEYTRLLRKYVYDETEKAFEDVIPTQSSAADKKKSMMLAASGDLPAAAAQINAVTAPAKTYEELFNFQRDYTREKLERDLGIVSGYIDGYVSDYSAYEQAAQNLAKFDGGDWSLEAMRAKTGTGVPILGENNIPWYDETLRKYDADTQVLRDKMPVQDLTYEDYVAYRNALDEESAAQEKAVQAHVDWENEFNRKWGDISSREGYDEFQLPVLQRNQYGGGLTEEEDLYDQITNGIYTQTAEENSFLKGNTGYEKTGYQFMTDEERKKYGFLLFNDSEEAAREYRKDLQPELWRRRNDKRTADTREWADKNALNATIASFAARGANVIAPVEGGIAMLRDVLGDDVDPNDPMFDRIKFGQLADSTVAGKIAENTEWANIAGLNIPSMFYGGATSAIDSAIAGSVYGPLAEYALGLRTAGSELQQSIEAGDPRLQRIFNAVSKGAFEGITEHSGLDAMFGDTTSSVKYALKNMSTETMEETLNFLLGTGYDLLFNDDAKQRIARLEYEGYTPSEARRKYAKELGREGLETALTAFFTGGMTGTVGAVNINNTNRQYGNNIVKNGNGNTRLFLDTVNSLDGLDPSTKKMIQQEYAALEAQEATQKAAEPPKNASEQTFDEFDESTAGETVEPSEAAQEEVQQEVAEQKPSGKKDGKPPKSSAARLGRIFREAMSLLDEQSKAVLADHFSANQITAMLDERAALDKVAPDAPMKKLLANAVAKVIDGQQITPDEARMLTTSNAAMATVQDLTAAAAERDSINATAADLAAMADKNPGKSAEQLVEETAQQEAAEEAPELESDMVEPGLTIDEYAAEYGNNADLVKSVFNSGRTQNATEFAHQFKIAYNYGSDGRNLGEMIRSGRLDALTDAQKTAAYSLGRDVRMAKYAAAREASPTGVTVGNVDRSAISGMRLNRAQNASVSAIGRLAKAVGFNVKFVASQANAEGKYTSENGKYDRATRTITIDVNAGRLSTESANYAMMQTAGHELTHYIKQFADGGMYSDYQEFVLNHLSLKMKEGDIDARIRKTIADNAKLGKTLTREQAIDEIVADASGDVLMSLTESDIRELAQTKPTLLQTIGKYFERWIASVKALIKQGFSGQTNRNAIAEQMLDVADELGRKWVALLKDANVRAVESTGELLVTTKQGAAVSAEVAEVMNSDRYEAPDDGLFSIRETDAWAEAHRKEYPDDKNFDDNLALIRNFESGIVQDSVLRFLVPHGRVTKTTQGPLRNNIEYRRTFDMDTKCERTYQFLAYRDAIQKKIGRQLYEDEARNLIELMRAYGQMIPCTYCYVEGKRMRLAELYLKAIKKSGKEALGRDITPEQVFDSVESARAIVSGWLDSKLNVPENYQLDDRLAGEDFEGYRDLVLPMSAEQATEQVCDEYGITDRAAKRVMAGFVAEWEYNRRMDLPMQLAVDDADYRTGTIDQAVLAFHDRATKTAQGGAKAKGIENYEPYIDQLKSIPVEDKRFMNGMGGIRKHSSNDFQIQNVHDYMLFFMDLAADRRGGTGWYGHTYTKNADYARIFAPTNDRINVSIAMYGDKSSGIRPNEQEGAVWDEVKALRKKYKNVGAMAMATNNDQLSFALNSDWIDMIIPFHASGIPKKYWNNSALKWMDFTSKQSERLYNGTQMKQMLKERGINVPSSMKAAEVRQLFDETFGIKAVYNEKTGKRFAPHFYPYETEKHGAIIPGHGNSAERYFELCREYGVNPRFYGLQVEDANGNLIPITEHPGYLKLIKETARTDTPQEEIVAKFDMAEINRAMKGFRGYANMANDAYGIVDEFIEQYVGKNRPQGYLTERALDTREILGEMAEEANARGERVRELMLENIQKYGEEGVAENAMTGVDDGVAFSARDGADSDPNVNLQVRDPYQITDREILANAMDSLAKNKEELDILQRYRARVVELSEKQYQLEQINTRIVETRKAGGSRDEIIKEQNRAQILRNQIDRLDKQLQQRELAVAIKSMAKRERDAMRIEHEKTMRKRETEQLNRRLERQQERYDKLKDKYDKDIAEQKQKVKDVRAEKNESFARAKYLDEVRNAADKMRTLLTTPTNKAHVPEFLRAPLGDFIEALDFSSVSSIEGKGSTKADEKLKAAMDRLHSALVDVRSRQNGDAAKEYMGYIDLPDGFVDEFNRLRTSIGVVLDTSDQFAAPINRMNSEQLHELAKAFRVLHASISNMNRLIANAKYASAINAAADTVSDLEPLVQKNTRNKLLGKALDFLDWKNTVPYYVFKRFGKGGQAIFDGLMDGWDKLARNADEVVKFTDGAYTTKEVQSWEKEIHDVTLSNGETVRMTTAQLMSLYCLARREQAKGHLLGGGIRIADIEGKVRKVSQTENYTLTQADLDHFGDLLTARQREVADKLQRYMAVKGAEWGNYVSMKRFGYNMFTEANYFPIESDKRNMPEVDPQAEENSMYRLLNMSATKGLVQNANNAVVVRSIFDVFTGHMSDMAKYNALGLQLLDAIKWFNFVAKETDTDGTVKTVSVRKALESAYGDEARKYFNEFMRNLNGETEGGREDGLLNKATSRYKIAATAANVRVGLLQITSMPRAAYVINPKYLAVGLAKWNASRGKNSGKAVENVGIAKWKSLGFYDTNISRNMRELIKHDQTVTDKVREGSMKLAEWGDAWTMGVLYGAVEAELKAKGITEGHPDFKRQMNNRMREIVYQTQVVDSTMTRSHLMRQKGGMAMFTSFMSEPTIAVNMLNDAIFEARMKARSGDKNWFPAALPKVARAMAVTTAVSTASALVEALMTAFRDDDEFEEFADKFNKALLGDYSSAESFADYWAAFMSGSVGGNLNVLSNIPIVKNLLESAQGSTAEEMVTKWISTLTEGVTSLYKVIMEPDSTTADYYRAVYKTVNGMSQLTGIAAGGAMRDVVAAYNTFGAEPMGWKRIQTYDNSEKEAVKAIFAAQKAGDADLAAYYRERFAVYGMDEEKLSKALATLAEDAYIEGGVSRDFAADMLSESGKSDRKVEKALTQAEYEIETGLEYGDMKEDFVAGTISEEQARAYLKEYNGMRDREIDEKLGEWRYEKDTGYVYSAMKEDYLDGELTEQEAIDHRVEYGGADVGDARETVNKWRYEKDTGLVYSEMKLDYEDGVLTESQVRSYLTEYGGKDEEKIEETISQYDYYIATGRTTTAPKYWRIAYAFDSGDDADTLIKQAFDEIMYGGEKKKSWKQARSQLASSLAAYYKKEYLAIKGTEKGNRMLERILTLYEKIGYTRSYQSQYIEENWTDD